MKPRIIITCPDLPLKQLKKIQRDLDETGSSKYLWIFNKPDKLDKIKKIADKYYEERWDTDWDSLHEALMKIYKLVNKK